jgi:hypothetical protein
MGNSIDQIVYGDLLFDDKAKISCQDKIIGYCFATGLINKFFAKIPPKNSSQQTINELLFLERVTSNASQEEINFATKAEIEEKNCYVDFCKNNLGLDINIKFFDDLLKQIDPILMLLKNHFNRPRPYQIAPYYNIQLRFRVPIETSHAAYPSGHALDALIINYALSKILPEQTLAIQKFCNDMAFSRFVAGVHYPSDNEMSKFLADNLISHNLIKVPNNI